MLTDLDNLNLPDDYIYVTKNRKKFKKASGGIVVIYRKSLEKELNFYNTESQFVLWFKLSKSILSLNSDVIFGCVYVPPENSKYSTIEAFEELENELNILTNTENFYIALVGDFNSKTGSLPDYIIPDESVVSMFDLDCDADILDYLYDYENLTRNKITLQRVSQCTCRPNRLQATFSKSDSIVINNRNDKTFVRWKSEQKSEYVDRIHNDPKGILTTVMNKLDKLSVNNDATQNDINNIVLDISKNFKDAAAETFGKVNKHKHFYKHENSKPWFNRKCSMSRNKFHKARKRYSFLKNAENRSKMRQASKEHKVTLNKSFANYQQRAADELRNISKKDTKALWKILNNLNDSKKKDNNDDISLKALYDHFKILNETVETENDFEQDLEFDTLPDDVELFLNCPVTEDEIKKVVSNLKNGKASGSDEILNEYIKNTIDDLMPIYVKLFNLILDTGIVPDSWSNGIMITIFKNKGSRSDPEMYRGITLNSCFSKTFSAMLNYRLNNYADHVDLISKAQAGFRRGFSTVDNIFMILRYCLKVQKDYKKPLYVLKNIVKNGSLRLTQAKPKQ
ncbi:uncharacterized protein LOC134727423 [Mytilus trossulus]|uniref:uncharacterized protein LOC134727423 n=1 Tax=Mytilus trossulus TaxID=6551 RepID=UPI003005899E